MAGGHQLFAGRCIDPVKARRYGWGATDPHMNFARPRLSYDANDLGAGCPSNNGIIDQDDSLSFQQAADRVELQLHAEIAQGLAWLDEGTPHVMVPDEGHLHGDAGFLGEAGGGGYARVRDRNHQVRLHWMLPGQLPAQKFTAGLHGPTEDHTVRTRKIDMLKNTL